MIAELLDAPHSKILSPSETSIKPATTRVPLSAREHRSRLMAESAAHSSSVVPVAGDAAASPGALASPRSPRSARSETDGGKNAYEENQRTAASDKKGALRSGGAYHRGPAALSRGIGRARQRSPTCATSAGCWRGRSLGQANGRRSYASSCEASCAKARSSVRPAIFLSKSIAQRECDRMPKSCFASAGSAGW